MKTPLFFDIFMFRKQKILFLCLRFCKIKVLSVKIGGENPLGSPFIAKKICEDFL